MIFDRITKTTDEKLFRVNELLSMKEKMIDQDVKIQTETEKDLEEREEKLKQIARAETSIIEETKKKEEEKDRELQKKAEE